MEKGEGVIRRGVDRVVGPLKEAQDQLEQEHHPADERGQQIPGVHRGPAAVGGGGGVGLPVVGLVIAEKRHNAGTRKDDQIEGGKGGGEIGEHRQPREGQHKAEVKLGVDRLQGEVPLQKSRHITVPPLWCRS